MSDIGAWNFFRDAEAVADPYAYYEAMRGQCPVQREPHHDVVMVTGYEEAVEIFHDSERFSSCTSVTGPFPGFPVPLEGDDVSALIEEHRGELPMSDQLPVLDPPVHTAHRSLLMRLITPKRLKENEEFMWRIADRMLDKYLAPGPVEFVGGFASPFTLLVIADLLGLPEEDRDEFAETINHRNRHDAAIGSTADEAMAKDPMSFLYERFGRYVAARREEPREDVLTGMATATFPDGTTPTVDDVVRVAANLFSAGQETTVRLLSAALLVLAEHPDLADALRADKAKISNFIEETLRWESPIKGDFRLSRVPVTVGGVDLPAGTTVMLLNAAANRDPRRFENPADFDPARSNARQHIAFGRGIHTCPGAPLARAEARVAIERILDRTTGIRLSEEHHGPAGSRDLRYLPTFILRGLTHLFLEFDLVEDAK